MSVKHKPIMVTDISKYGT